MDAAVVDRGDCELFIEGVVGFTCLDRIVGAPIIIHKLIKRNNDQIP